MHESEAIQDPSKHFSGARQPSLTNTLQTTCFSNLCAQNLGPLWSHRERLGEILGYLPTLQLRGKLGMHGIPRQASTSNAQHLLIPGGCTGGCVRGWVDG